MTQQPSTSGSGAAPVAEDATTTSGGAGPVRLLSLVAAALGIIVYLLGFFGEFRFSINLFGPFVLGGALLSGAAILPRTGRLLTAAAVVTATGGLMFLQLLAAGGAPTVGVIAGALAVVQTIVAVGALLLDIGVITAPAPRPARSAAPYGQQGGFPQGYGQQGPGGYGQQGYPGQPGQQGQPGYGQQPPFGAQPQQFGPQGQPGFGAQPGFGQGQQVPQQHGQAWGQPPAQDPAQGQGAWYTGDTTATPLPQQPAGTPGQPNSGPSTGPTSAVPSNAQPTAAVPMNVGPTVAVPTDTGATMDYRVTQGTETPAVGQPVVTNEQVQQGDTGPNRYQQPGEHQQG